MLDEESGNNLENKEQPDSGNQTVGDLPTKNPEIKYPVKPKDSASLIVLRNKESELQVLMGRRGRKAIFSNVYVFPGGDCVQACQYHLRPRLDNI